MRLHLGRRAFRVEPPLNMTITERVRREEYHSQATR
jgi:hypothetical protein